MWKEIKSKYILIKIFEYLKEKKYLELIKYNKNLQEIFNITLNNYIHYDDIEIELIPTDYITEKNIFINLIDNRSYFHFYFNDNDEEVKENYIPKKEKIEKIRVSLNCQIKSFKGLFKECACLKEIYFIKCNRKDIVDLSEMFEGCSSLIKLDISRLITDNVTNMSWMFYNCKSLLEINILNFNTSKVTDMTAMFKNCVLIKELNLENFNTSKVTNMRGMFFKCESLEQLNLFNFDTSKVEDMRWMFEGCSSLRELNIYNFNTSKVTDMRWMFEGCSSLTNLDVSSPLINGEVDMEFGGPTLSVK